MPGNRPGRPRKLDKYGGHVAAAESRIADRLPQLIDNLMRLAEGVWTEKEVVGQNGAVIVYRTIPDRQANQYLIDRLMGKPTESIHHSGDHGESEQFFDALHAAPGDPGPAAEGD
jgi:hypothetical protein